MSDPNLTTFQGRMCTKVRRQVTNTAPPASTSTSVSTSTSTSTTSTSTSQSNSPPAQNPPPANTPSTSTSTTPVPRLPNRPPQENPQVPPPPTTTSASTSTTTTPAAVVNPPPAAASPSTSTTSTNAPPAVVVPAPIPDGRNTQPPQIAPGTPNTGVPVQTSPPSGGQNRQPTDPGAVNPPPSSGGDLSPIAAPIAQPQLGGGGSQPIAQPDTDSPVQVNPAPILSPTGQTGAAPVRSEAAITFEPVTSTTVLLSTATDGSVASLTSPVVITPSPHSDGDGHTGSDHSSSGPGHSSSSSDGGAKVQPGAVVGAVFGVVSFLAIVGLLFFCFRRRRNGKRNSGTPLIANDSGSSLKSGFSTRFGTFFAARRPSGESFSNAKVAMTEKMGAVFAVRPMGDKFSDTKAAFSQKFGGMFGRRDGAAGDADAGVARTPTPGLERGMDRDNSSSVYSNSSRNRASSVPVMALRTRAMDFFSKGRSKSRPRFGHKRETSDLSFVGDKVTASALPPRLPSPVAQHRRSTSSVADFIQSWNSTDETNDPFRDPDSSQPLTVKNGGLSRSNTAKSGAPKLSPILQSKVYNQSPPLPQTTYGIGVAVADSPSSFTKQSQQIPRHERSFSQAQVRRNPFADPSSMARPVSPTSIYTTADTATRPVSRRHSRGYTVSMGRPLQHQPSKSSVDSGFESAKSPIPRLQKKDEYDRPDSDPLKQWHLSGVLSSHNGSKSTRTSTSSQDNPFADDIRISDFQFFDNSSPDVNSSRYPSYLDRQSRVSDPFDLDRPEVLGGMKPTWSQTMASRATSLSRRDSSRSRGTPITPAQRTANPQSGYFLSSDVYHPS